MHYDSGFDAYDDGFRSEPRDDRCGYGRAYGPILPRPQPWDARGNGFIPSLDATYNGYKEFGSPGTPGGMSTTSTAFSLSPSKVSPEEAALLCRGALADVTADLATVTVSSCDHGCTRLASCQVSGRLEWSDLPPEETVFELREMKPGYAVVSNVVVGPVFFKRICWKLKSVNGRGGCDDAPGVYGRRCGGTLAGIGRGDRLVLEGPRWAMERWRQPDRSEDGGAVYSSAPALVSGLAATLASPRTLALESSFGVRADDVDEASASAAAEGVPSSWGQEAFAGGSTTPGATAGTSTGSTGPRVKPLPTAWPNSVLDMSPVAESTIASTRTKPLTLSAMPAFGEADTCAGLDFDVFEARRAGAAAATAAAAATSFESRNMSPPFVPRLDLTRMDGHACTAPGRNVRHAGALSSTLASCGLGQWLPQCGLWRCL